MIRHFLLSGICQNLQDNFPNHTHVFLNQADNFPDRIDDIPEQTDDFPDW